MSTVALLQPFCTLHDRVTDWGNAAAAAAVGIIVLSSGFEVVARYFFNAPTTWAYDATGYLFCAAIFLSAPHLSRIRGHVAITLLHDASVARTRFILHIFIQAAALITCAFVAWIAFDETRRQMVQGIQTMAVRPIPKWLISSFIVYGMSSSALYFMRHFLSSARDRFRIKMDD